ncbi:MAG: hypothetical protein AAB916_02995 [Patescibacteria group bacterium]
MADMTSQLGLDWALRKKADAAPKPADTRKAIDVIMDLYPPKWVDEIPPEWVENSKRYVRSGGGLPGEKVIVNDNTLSEAEKNLRLRQFHASRISQENAGRRDERLLWQWRLSNNQREQLELVGTNTLKIIFREDSSAERDKILAAIVEKTLAEKIQGTSQKISQALGDAGRFPEWIYTQLNPQGQAVIDEWHTWAEHRRQRREQRKPAFVSARPWVALVPLVAGALLFIATFIF